MLIAVSFFGQAVEYEWSFRCVAHLYTI